MRWATFCAVWAASVVVGQEYSITDVGPSETLRDNSSTVTGINRYGRVTGWAASEDGSTDNPFIWRYGVFSRADFGGRAEAINAHDEIVGQRDVEFLGFLWDGSSSVIDLPTLGGPRSRGWDINSAGTVVGSADKPSIHGSAASWIRGEVFDLGFSFGAAFAINEAGAIALFDGGSDGYMMTEEGTIPLGRPFPDYDATLPLGINERNEIVGAILFPPHIPRVGFLWRDGQYSFLPGLFGEPGDKAAFALNDHSEVVGYFAPMRPGRHAVRWFEGQALDLNDAINDETWRLEHALDINNAGQIVGVGQHGEWERGFILTPRTCRDFIRGDINCDGTIDTLDIEPLLLALFDVETYAGQFPECNWLCNADVNWDGTVDALDIEPFVDLLFP